MLLAPVHLQLPGFASFSAVICLFPDRCSLLSRPLLASVFRLGLPVMRTCKSRVQPTKSLDNPSKNQLCTAAGGVLSAGPAGDARPRAAPAMLGELYEMEAY